ncbi:MAG: prolyl oligopeptidase family serine peptidase [Phycisphaerae bacterium]
MLHGFRFFPACVFATLALLPTTGCVVGQPRGEGTLTREVEPIKDRGYWRYLPKDYVKADDAARRQRRWPLVVSFHGMKPFDNSHSQALEWEQEADRYGMIVIAPELNAPDVLAEFPVRTIHPWFKGDEEASLAIVSHVLANTYADSSNVLSTSWSSGGYMAHYMMNRHPERFTCLAVRQSNFSRAVLDRGCAARGASHPVLIVNTENDFAICKEESKDAVNWYTENGYPNVAWVYIKSLGHERTPDLAADFFARIAGTPPGSAPSVLVQRQAIDGNARGLAFLAGKSGAPAPRAEPSADVVKRSATPERPTVAQANRPAPAKLAEPPLYLRNPSIPTPSREPVLVRSPSSPPPAATISDPTAPRANAAPAAALRRTPVAIRVSSGVGVEPLSVGFSAECPSDWQRTADFHWSLNGEAIGSGITGQKTIVTPGDHTLTLLVVTADGVEYSASQVVRVLPRSMLGTASASTR